MTLSELMARLEKAKADWGDIEVGFYLSPGATSFDTVSDIERLDVNAWSKDWKDRPPLPERVAAVLWTEGEAFR